MRSDNESGCMKHEQDEKDNLSDSQLMFIAHPLTPLSDIACPFAIC